MIGFFVRPCPLRILAAPGQWPWLSPEATLALQSAPWVLWQPGADPSLLALLGPHQRLCELSHDLKVPCELNPSGPKARDLVLIQGPSAPAPDWSQSLGPGFARFETIDLASAGPGPASTQVILTRSHAHNLDLAASLAKAGIACLSFPTLRFGPPPDPRALQQTLASLDRFFGVIVSSPRGAKVLAKAPKLPEALKVVAVGAATRSALQAHQHPCHLTPKRAHSEGLVQALAAQNWLNKHWLHLRGNLGRDVLKTAIESAKGTYTLAVGYQSLVPDLAPALRRASQAPHLSIICFSSGQSYFNYKGILSKTMTAPQIRAHLGRLRIVSFGPITSQAIRQDGQSVDCELGQPSPDAQRDAIMSMVSTA